MSKAKFSIMNCDLKANMLPRLLSSTISDEWEFSSNIFPRLKEQLIKLLDSEFPNGISDDDAEFDNQFDKIEKIVTAKIERFFIVNVGKKMPAKFAGKAIDGTSFEAGDTIYYWSNSVDKGIVLPK